VTIYNAIVAPHLLDDAYNVYKLRYWTAKTAISCNENSAEGGNVKTYHRHALNTKMDVCQTENCVQHYTAAEFENEAENGAWIAPLQ
jgi:hypothetical protein